MTPQQIVDKMLEKDAFSTWLGINVLELEAGSCKLSFVIREDMCNGFGTAHGGIAHSAADSALAFACNTYGEKAVAAETSISYLRPLKPGDLVYLEAKEDHRGTKLGRYTVKLYTEKEDVALFRATCYFLGLKWTL